MMQGSETLIERWSREYENDPEYRAEGLATDTIEQVIDKLSEIGKNQVWLANQLGVPRQQVSRMLNAPPNLTLLSIARLSIALETKARIIFDSEAFYVWPKAEPASYEDFKTESAIWQANAAATRNKSELQGVDANATV